MDNDVQKFMPFAKRLLVKKTPLPKTKSGLIMPESDTNNVKDGVVAAVADDVETHFPEGTRVFFNRYAGVTLELEGFQDYVVLKSDEVLGYIVP